MRNYFVNFKIPSICTSLYYISTNNLESHPHMIYHLVWIVWSPSWYFLNLYIDFFSLWVSFRKDCLLFFHFDKENGCPMPFLNSSLLDSYSFSRFLFFDFAGWLSLLSSWIHSLFFDQCPFPPFLFEVFALFLDFISLLMFLSYLFSISLISCFH